MTTNTTFDMRRHRAREARLITAALALVCGIGFVSAVVPGVERAITTGLLIAGATLALVTAGRVAARRMRHRREDRADALAAAAWRAHHAPHLLAAASARRAA